MHGLPINFMKNKKNNNKEGVITGACINGGRDLVTTKRGFSLVEVLFSLLVLTLGIAGVLTLMTGNIKNAVDAKNQVIASQLAQEGYEMVRNLRDNTNLNSAILPANKLSHDGNCVDSNKYYGVDPFNNMSCPWSGSSYPALATKALYVDGATPCSSPNTGLYSYAATCPSGPASVRVKSNFYRVIIMDNSVPSQIAVKIYVTWNGTGFPAAATNLDSFCTVANQCVSLISILPDSN